MSLHLLRWSSQDQGYIITMGSAMLSPEITASRDAWILWLDTVSSFAFESRSGEHCTVRKERLQRGDVYWYAYRSIEGHTKKRYLGKTADLSFAKLEEVVTRFTMESREVSQIASLQQAQPATQSEMASVLTPLLETKLHPSQLPTFLVERTHLLSQLDKGFAYKLTLLLAPAGFGKSTLVHQWLAARDASPALAWLSLDSGDNDPLRFWRYIITACQSLLGQEQQASEQAALEFFTSAMHSPFELLSMDTALTGLLNGLAASASGGLLVLDDYHVIIEARIHEALTFFIDHLPATVHVLLLSRSEPPLPLLRWRARGELFELHGADLRFSAQETETFLRQMLPFSLSETALTRLDASLEGWAAGLRLLALALSRWRTPQAIEQALLSLGERAGFSGPHRSLLDYFVSEILETQPEPLQLFLLQTSVLSCLNGSLCDAITGHEGSAEQLAVIERAGLFLEALEGPGEWYRYHALFAEAMRREASHRLGEVALQTLSLRASSWYEQEALLIEAIEAAWLARDVERMARLIEQVDEQYFYEPQTMRRWLEQLPETVLRAHPMLCVIFAIELRFPVELRFAQTELTVSEVASPSDGERLRVEALLQMAEEGYQSRGMQEWIGSLWAFRALSALLDQEPFSSLATYAQRAIVLLPVGETRDRRLQMWRGSCLVFVGTEELCQGQIAEAHQHLLQAQKDNAPPGNKYLGTSIRAMLGKSHLLQGELQEASRYSLQVLTDTRELHDDEMAADALLELAWLAFEWNNLIGAEQQTREALDVARREHPPRQELLDRAAMQLALLQYARGESGDALVQLTALLAGPRRAWTRSSFWLFSRLRVWQGRLMLAAGDVQAVQDNLEVWTQSSENASITEHLSEEILRGRLLLAQKRDEDARRHFARLLLIAKAQLHHYAALEIQLLLVLAHEACKQEQQAHYWLRQTLLQAVHEGYIRLFLNEGKPLIRLLRSLFPSIRDKALREYIQTILRAEIRTSGQKRATRAISPSSDGPLLEPLSEQEQRVLQLLVVGWSNADIARELVISVNTVKYHVKHLYQKLSVSNRLQASEVARELKLARF